MGSFNVSCSVSRKTITMGDDILVFLGSQAEVNGYSLPFYGTYNDCGQIKLSKNKTNFYVFDLLKRKMLKKGLFFENNCFHDLEKYEILKKAQALTTEQCQILEDFFSFQQFIEIYHDSKFYGLNDDEQKQLIQKNIAYVEGVLNLSFSKNEYWEKKSNLLEGFFLFTDSLIKTNVDFKEIENDFLDPLTLSQIEQFLNHFLYFFHEMRTEGLTVSDLRNKNICAHMVLKSVYDDVIGYDGNNNDEWSHFFSLNFKDIVAASEAYKKLQEFLDKNHDNKNFVLLSDVNKTYYLHFLDTPNLYPIFDHKFKSLLFKDNFDEKEIVDLILNFASKNFVKNDDNFPINHFSYVEPYVYEKMIKDEDFLKLKSLFLNNIVVKHYCFLYKTYYYGMHVAPIIYTGQDPDIYDDFFHYVLGKAYQFF